MIRSAFVACLLVLITACSGWHLRGSQSAAQLNASVAVAGKAGAVAQQVSEQLSKQQRLAVGPQADFQLSIGAEKWSAKQASTTNIGKVAEYELVLSLPYDIQQNQKPIASRNLKVIRSYQYDASDSTSKSKEEALIKREMQQTAARRILQHLSVLQRDSND